MKGVTLLVCLTALYAIFLAAISLLNWSGADRFWPGALNLYPPQFLWALPGIFLALLLLRHDRYLFWLPLICVAWVLGPIMDFRWSADPAVAASRPVHLRVMTWNIKYGFHDLAPLIEDLTRYSPDVVLFQDAVGALDGPLREYFGNWQVRQHGQYLIASRHPLFDAEVHPIHPAGEGQEYLRCRLRLEGEEITLYNVHFKTPRWSLNAFRTARHNPWYLPEAVAKLSHNAGTRLKQAQAVSAEVAREAGPVIVAGDLNSPDAGRPAGALREAGLRDAFAERGRGYGFTYGHFLFQHRLPWLKISWMRIDHIMVNGRLRTEKCWTGTGKGSDHRPVVADLVLLRP